MCVREHLTTIWGVPSFAIFSFVLFRKFWLQIWLHNSCSTSPTASGTCRKYLQNIANEGTPRHRAYTVWHPLGHILSLNFDMFHWPVGWYCSYCAAQLVTGTWYTKQNLMTEWVTHSVSREFIKRGIWFPRIRNVNVKRGKRSPLCSFLPFSPSSQCTIQYKQWRYSFRTLGSFYNSFYFSWE